MIPRLALFSAFSGLLISTVHATDAITAGPDGCVDKSGMQHCLTTAESQLGDCGKDAQGDIQLNACMLTYDISLLGCYIQSCWNKVYSCEYQLVVVDFLTRQYPPPEEPIPFWPPPDNAPGGCVCNFGTIYDGVLAGLDHLQSDCNQYMGSVSSLSTCQCCAWGSALSAFYGTCPGYDLTNYGLAAIASTAGTTEYQTGSCSDLTSSVCQGKFGIESLDDGVYPDAANLLEPGSKALTTTQGPGPLTSPPGGATMTVTVLGEAYTLTAAKYNADDVGETDTSSSTDSSDEPAAETSTSSSSTSGAGSSNDSNDTSSNSSSNNSTDPNSAHRNIPLTVGMGLVIALAFVVMSL
ncbi:hypothetical protein BJX64DRAFT_284163 [Aspergillus heterothallicus]